MPPKKTAEDKIQIRQFKDKSSNFFINYAHYCINENEEIVLLRSISENELVGYCILSSEKNKAGDKTGFGGLGPIGIAKKIRGNQVGNYILCQSLVKAGDVGVTRVNIDWTILKDFYGQFGFTAQRIYRAGYIEL